MNLRKLMALVTVTALLACNAALAADNTIIAPVVPSVSAAESKTSVGINIEQRHYETSNSFVDAEIPLITGLSDIKFQEELNSRILAQAEKDEKELVQMADKDAELSAKSGFQFRPYGLYIRYSIKSLEPVLSFITTSYVQTPGTGNPRLDCYNIDTRTMKELSLSDLFKKDSDYVSRINEDIREQIRVTMETDSHIYFTGKNGFSTISQNQKFYVHDGELVIVFSKYEIAPGASGQPEFHLPLSRYRDLLLEVEPLMYEGSYYNESYGFSFKMPPLWKGKVSISETFGADGALAKTYFSYVPADKTLSPAKLVTLSVYNSETFTETSGKNSGIQLSLNGAYVHTADIGANPFAKGTTAALEYERFLQALDGINDLFSVTDVRNEIDQTAKTNSKEKVLINGKAVKLNNLIYPNRSNVLMAPLRQTAEALGYEVKWNDEARQAELIRAAQYITVLPGKDQYGFAKMVVKLGVAAEIKDDRTYVPVSFFSEVLKLKAFVGPDQVVTISE